MPKQGLLVRLEAANGRDQELESFLASAPDAGATASFAVRFGRSEYGVFAFPGVGIGPGADLLASEPRSQQVSVLADKRPDGAAAAAVTPGLLLTFAARQGQQAQLERFLRSARDLVAQEPGTTAWFALRLAGGAYGLFSVFADSDARFAHLAGELPRALTGQALALLDGVPDMDLLEVLAARSGS
jgi:hypothetical protein